MGGPARSLGTPGGAAQHTALWTARFHTHQLPTVLALHQWVPHITSLPTSAPKLPAALHGPTYTYRQPPGRAECSHVSSQTDWAAGLCPQVQDFPKHTTVKCFLSLFQLLCLFLPTVTTSASAFEPCLWPHLRGVRAVGFKKYQMSNFAYGETNIQVLNNKLDHKFLCLLN